jgi:adenylosuccinate synthase
MTCTIVVGAQYGSEGKGKVATLSSRRMRTPYLVRCGGPNSGHTTEFQGRDVVVRQLPSGFENPDATMLLSAGCIVDVDVLLLELDRFDVARERIVVDPNAVIVLPEDREAEATIVADIGSTGSGTGAATARRVRRDGIRGMVASCTSLRERVRVERVAPLVHRRLDSGGDVLVEGTQGFGLSLLHCDEYPFATSRDTTAASFMSEVGIAPADVTDVVLVLRTFPIRVGGNSGLLPDEISWSEVQRISGAPVAIPEYTTETKRPRRVARYDASIVRAAVRYNRPTSLAIMGLDRVDFRCSGAREYADLTNGGRGFLERARSEFGVPIGWIGTGFGTAEAFLQSAK